MSERTLTHVSEIEDGAEELLKILSTTRTEENIRELLRLIHNPGWTTPAEFIFVQAVIDQMATQAKAISELGEGLVAGAREVGAER